MRLTYTNNGNNECKIVFFTQVVEYIDGDYASSESDSDSESYDEFWSKLWAYPKSGLSVWDHVRDDMDEAR